MALAEIMGSRNETREGKMKYGFMLYVTAAQTDIRDPDGSQFFTPKGGSAESDVTGRRLLKDEADMETLPGLILVRSTYAAYRAYA